MRLLPVGEGDFREELEAKCVRSARLAVVVVHQKDVEAVGDGGVVGREDVGKEEVRIDDAVFLGGGPVRHEDRGHYRLAPTLVDVREVVLGDLNGLAARSTSVEIGLDESTEFRLVLREIEFKRGGFKDADEALVEVAELARLVVGRGDVPVEVVLIEDIYHLRIGDERNPRGVEGGKVLQGT